MTPGSQRFADANDMATRQRTEPPVPAVRVARLPRSAAAVTSGPAAAVTA